MERKKSKSGIELVAEENGCVMMTLPMIKPLWLPMFSKSLVSRRMDILDDVNTK